MGATSAQVDAEQPAGWYADPWGLSPWRWWNGVAWTSHVRDTGDKEPSLPSWLSGPVLTGLVLTTLFLVGLLAYSPRETLLGIVLGVVPLIVVFPVLAWLDRVEPEPLASRVHAMLWGAAVAGFCSGLVNSIVAVVAGEAWAIVVSAPIVEEITKGAGVIWALKRRREVDGVMDGIVYAGWIGLGFAIVEDITYFANAAAAGSLTEVFILRALLTPFAHPLFTAWIGLAVGLAVQRRQSVTAHALWGLGLAITSHAAWNGTITYADETQDQTALAIAASCFVALFVAATITVVVIRRGEQRRFTQLVPILANRHGLTQAEVSVFGDWKKMLATRRRLPRDQRRDFDIVHAALARLALFYRRHGDNDPANEQLLSAQLQQARSASFNRSVS